MQVIDKQTNILQYKFENVCEISDEKFPVKYSLPHENTGTLKHQKYEDCVACVISSLAEVMHKEQFGENEEYSEGYTYGTLRNPNSTREGMVIEQALDLWRIVGCLPKKFFRLTAEMPEIKKLCAKYPELAEIAAKHTIKGYAKIDYADKSKRDRAVKTALTKYGHGLVAVSKNGFGRTAHCIQLIGWDDNSDKYIIKNSYGESYGDKGFGNISKDKINSIYLVLFDDIALPFNDVRPNDWFYKAVKSMYCSGLINGTSETTFEPDKPLTRAEATVLIYRVLKEIDKRFDLSYKEEHSIGYTGLCSRIRYLTQKTILSITKYIKKY